jgi:hypothetical protein
MRAALASERRHLPDIVSRLFKRGQAEFAVQIRQLTRAALASERRRITAATSQTVVLRPFISWHTGFAVQIRQLRSANELGLTLMRREKTEAGGEYANGFGDIAEATPGEVFRLFKS